MTKGVRMNIDDFVLRAVIAGLCIAIAAGPMGCIVLWRRMAYVGDATAHAAILGIALSLTWHIPILFYARIRERSKTPRRDMQWVVAIQDLRTLAGPKFHKLPSRGALPGGR